MPFYSHSKHLLMLLIALILASCTYSFIPDSDFFEEEVSQSFANVLNIIKEKDALAFKEAAIAEFQQIEGYDKFMAEYFSTSGNPTNAQLIYAEHRKSDNTVDAIPIFYAIYEYPNESNFEVIELALQEVNGNCCFLRHFKYDRKNIQSAPYHDFKVNGLSFKRITFLALMILTLLYIVITAFFVIRDKQLKLKWLWVLFVLFGTYGATLNWTTAELSPNFISFENGFSISIIKFKFLGGGFLRAELFQPWIFEWGFPLGAFIYTCKCRLRKRDAKVRLASEFSGPA